MATQPCSDQLASGPQPCKRRRSEQDSSALAYEADLVFELLKGLPIKTLAQLRCVCKLWNSIISSPLFIHNHYSLSKPESQSHLVLKWTDKKGISSYAHQVGRVRRFSELTYQPFTCRTSHGRRRLSLIDAINGVLCLTSETTTILWNLTLHRYINIPIPLPFDDKDSNYSSNLGFGFDNRTHDFKLVRLWLPGKPLPLAYDVYSPREGGWRRKMVCNSNIRPGKVVSTASFFMNGTIHWITSAYKKSLRLTEYYTLLMFDCESQEFRALKLPRAFNRWDCNIRKPIILKCEGMLSILIKLRGVMELWGMEEYGVEQKWKRLSINMHSHLLAGYFYLGFQESMYLMDINCKGKKLRKVDEHFTKKKKRKVNELLPTGNPLVQFWF